jgi:pimeloyl-ACP methyl ester carboxylesterase
MPITQLSRARLFHTEKGEGEPLVFLSGLAGEHGSWMGQLRAFARRFRCLAVENRDVGQSGYADEPYAIADLAADVAELLDALNAPRAHVVGLSMGGMIAQELALARPELVQSLILVGTLARSDTWFRGTLDAFGLIRRECANTPAFFEAILPWWVSHRFCEQPERVAWLRWLLHQSPYPQKLEGFLRQIQAAGKHDALDRLPRIRCPVAVLVGEDDSVAPLRYSQELRDRIPHAVLSVLPGVGHAPVLENPELFQATLNDHLTRHVSRQKKPA